MTIAHDCTPVDLRAGTARSPAAPTEQPRTIRVGLLGLGHVGSAVARNAGLAGSWRIQVTAALVRYRDRRRNASDVAVTTDAAAVFASKPDVIVEVLGGLEPARTLVLDALSRGIPVVTANKSLLAHHGEEILDASSRFGAPVRYEASVIAGVPFLGTFAGRPHASRVTALAGIVNGTTNFILSHIAGGQGNYGSALAEAQRCGYAEPDPAKDVRGIDAAEKLAILIHQFSGRRTSPDIIETAGIETIDTLDFAHARALGGTLKPVVVATGLDRSAPTVAAFSGPAFVPFENPLARLAHTTNGLYLRDVAGSLLGFTGPGAGPDVTALIVLDDVIDAATDRRVRNRALASTLPVAVPSTPWLLRLTHPGKLPPSDDIPTVLASNGVLAARTSIRTAGDGRWSHAVLTHPCDRASIERAAADLSARTGYTARLFRALDTLA